jgi:hypothetical protein
LPTSGSLQALASSTERTRLLELFPLQANEGPCLDCFRTGQPVSVSDLDAEHERWPAFASEDIREGFHSVHAVPLRLRREIIALNMFGTQPRAVSDQDLTVARALADTAAIGILPPVAGQHDGDSGEVLSCGEFFGFGQQSGAVCGAGGHGRCFRRWISDRLLIVRAGYTSVVSGGA